MADGKRRLAVVVEIETFDRFCSTADPYSRRWKGCGFLQADDAICGLFRVNLKGRDMRAERCPACLALDAPELSPAEAVARDLGAQHG